MPREREIGRDRGIEGARRSARCSAREGQRAAGRGKSTVGLCGFLI